MLSPAGLVGFSAAGRRLQKLSSASRALARLQLGHGTRAVDAVRWPDLIYVAGSLLGKRNAGVARPLLFLVRQMEMVHRKTNNFLLSSDRKTEQEWQTSCHLDVKSMRMTWHFRRLCVVQRWSAVFSVCILFRLGKEADGVHRFRKMWWRRNWKVCHECQPWQHLLNFIKSKVWGTLFI